MYFSVLKYFIITLNIASIKRNLEHLTKDIPISMIMSEIDKGLKN